LTFIALSLEDWIGLVVISPRERTRLSWRLTRLAFIPRRPRRAFEKTRHPGSVTAHDCSLAAAAHHGRELFTDAEETQSLETE
jgi:hypothetical protein